jgi:endo-1,3-1,4-beta-glycanase ExoK
MVKAVALACGSALALCAVFAAAAAREQSAASFSIASASEAPRPEAPFIERFQAPVLDERWRISHGWHSGEWFSSEWRASQTMLGPRGVTLTLAPRVDEGEKPYVSGEFSTREEYQYGYFESRLRMPRGRGLVAAFFTFTRPEGNETWNEIDMELTGYDTRRIELVYHVAGQATLEVVELPFDAAADYHTYAFEWRPNAIRWYIDNRLVHVSRGPLVSQLNRPQRIFASLWNSERMPRWLGVIDPSEAPWEMDIACIAYAPSYEGRSLCVD